MKKFNSISTFVMGLLVFSQACSKAPSEVSIKIPASFGSSSPVLSSALVGTPASLSDVDCYVVNVISPDVPRAYWDQKPGQTDARLVAQKALDGEPCAYGGIHSQLLPAALDQSINLIVPTGDKRLFQILGFKTGGFCSKGPVSMADYFKAYPDAAPVEIGRSIANISGSTTVNIKGKFDANRSTDKCSLYSSNQNMPVWKSYPLTLVTGKKVRMAGRNGRKFIAYLKYIDGTNDEIHVAEWINDQLVDLGGTFAASGIFADYKLSVDSVGNVYLGFTSGSSLILKKWTGSAWASCNTSGTIAMPGGGISSFDIAVNSADLVHAVYVTTSTPTAYAMKASGISCTTTWPGAHPSTFLSVYTGDIAASFSPSSNNLTFAYSNNTFNWTGYFPSDWISGTAPYAAGSIPMGSTYMDIDMDFDASGAIYVALNVIGQISVYKASLAGSWTLLGSSLTASTGSVPKISVGPNGPMIAFADVSAPKLFYFDAGMNSWNSIPNASFLRNGTSLNAQSMDLYVGPDNFAYMTYYDSTAHQLVLVRP